MTHSNLDYSIIVPLFNEMESLPKLQQAISSTMPDMGLMSYEVIYVDDGSADDSWKILQIFVESDSHVQAIRLPCHSGKATALAAGISRAEGKIIITLDADLQNDPNDIPQLIAKISDGSDLVCGWRKNRHDSKERVVLSWLFNVILEVVSGIDLHDVNCGFKAGKAEVFKSLKLYGQLHRYIPLLAIAHGFKVSETHIRHHPRRFGKSRYGLIRYFHAARDLPVALTIAKWSSVPKESNIVFRIATVITVVSCIAAAFLFAPWAGIASVVSSVLLGIWLFYEQHKYVAYGLSCIKKRLPLDSQKLC